MLCFHFHVESREYFIHPRNESSTRRANDDVALFSLLELHTAKLSWVGVKRISFDTLISGRADVNFLSAAQLVGLRVKCKIYLLFNENSTLTCSNFDMFNYPNKRFFLRAWTFFIHRTWKVFSLILSLCMRKEKIFKIHKGPNLSVGNNNLWQRVRCFASSSSKPHHVTRRYRWRSES